MAERVDKIPPALNGAKYPWDEWLDGSAWELIQGKDFETTINSFRTTARSAAKVRGIRVMIVVLGDLVYVQAKRG